MSRAFWRYKSNRRWRDRGRKRRYLFARRFWFRPSSFVPRWNIKKQITVDLTAEGTGGLACSKLEVLLSCPRTSMECSSKNSQNCSRAHVFWFLKSFQWYNQEKHLQRPRQMVKIIFYRKKVTRMYFNNPVQWTHVER